MLKYIKWEFIHVLRQNYQELADVILKWSENMTQGRLLFSVAALKADNQKGYASCWASTLLKFKLLKNMTVIGNRKL